MWDLPPTEYYETPLSDIMQTFLKDGGRGRRPRQILDEKQSKIPGWLAGKVRDYGACSCHATAELLRGMSSGDVRILDTDESENLKKQFGHVLQDAFLANDNDMPNFVVQDNAFFFNQFVEALRAADGHEAFRESLTRKLIAEADKDASRWLKCYMIGYVTEIPNGANAVDGHIDVGEIRVKTNIIKTVFDEGLLVKMMRGWRRENFPDPNARWALEAILQAYQENHQS